MKQRLQQPKDNTWALAAAALVMMVIIEIVLGVMR